ncbi:unnamed protein product [Aphanomyces euteiches]
MVAQAESVHISTPHLEELDVLVSEIEICTAAAKKASVSLLGQAPVIPRTEFSTALEALESCLAAARVALDHLNDVEKAAADENTKELAKKEGVEETSTEDNNVIEPNVGIYSSETDVAGSVQDHAQTQDSNEVQVDIVNHLMFVIHGIGEHTDFQDGQLSGTPELVGEYPVFRELFRTTRETFLSQEIPLALEIQSIEWHDEVHASGVDSVFDSIAPEGSDKIRQFNKRAFMDLLYYTAPKFSQVIVQSVTSQLNAKYKRFLDHHPGWDGQVSIFSHSLGTIIAYDILTHDAGDVSNIGVHYPGLEFAVENLFCAGSPVPVMVLSRGDVNLDPNGPESFKPPKVNHYYNFFHPLDPIGYRVEPLFQRKMSKVPAVQLIAADSVKNKSFAELIQLYPDPTRQDFILRRQAMEGMIDLAYAPFSHSSYWTSQDVVLFALLQICRPVADKIRAVQGAKAVLVPRHLTHFTPHERPRLATTAEVRDRSSGGWFPKSIILGHNQSLYYLSSSKEFACTKKWSIPLSANSRVEPVANDPLSLKLVPDTTNSLFSMLPPNSSVNATHVLKAATTDLRDEWVIAIQHVIENAGAAKPTRGFDTTGLVLPNGTSVDYFGAIKTSVLSNVWGSKWFVLHHSTLDCFDSVPPSDKWAHFSIVKAFISSREVKVVRFVNARGTTVSVKFSSEGLFDTWVDAIRSTKTCNTVQDDTIL